MNTHAINFENVKEAFNNVKVMKGQYTNIATSNEAGIPNVAPIGSMRIVDEKTVHILQGFLPRTLANLRKNPKATFSMCLRKSVLSELNVFKQTDDELLGYQVYCTYKGETKERDAIVREINAISIRVPFFARGALRKFCNEKLKRVLMFTIDDIRAIGAE